MVVGVGVDILALERFSNLYSGADIGSFISRVYTESEVKQAQNRSNTMHYLASRFAGKEAIFKSLYIPNNHVNLNEIEILNDSMGVPIAMLYGNIRNLAKKKHVTDIKVSLSNDGNYFIAYAISISDKNKEVL